MLPLFRLNKNKRRFYHRRRKSAGQMHARKNRMDANPAAPRLPFPLPVIQGKAKKKCCKKHKKGKRCKKCPEQ